MIVCALGELFMLDIVQILAPSFSENMQSKTANLASIMFPYLLFISASSFYRSYFKCKKKIFDVGIFTNYFKFIYGFRNAISFL